ncbi:hypothetical protein ACLB1G_27600 [Oxalobacteraceae bacterium A2-2]
MAQGLIQLPDDYLADGYTTGVVPAIVQVTGFIDFSGDAYLSPSSATG